ncbi:CPBP family intramembrane metalloprotease [Kribbella sp. NBC_01505]|uniref:CPBP family intramembrane glutamic endopeptidase n=1 Tax=Kribbella sp. NBC_01505 TaxID=2903580 RepID=UPI00386F8FBF
MTIAYSAAPAPAQVPQTVEPVSYDQLARVTGRHNWWRPIVGTFVLLGLGMVGIMLLIGPSEAIGAALDLPVDKDGMRVFGDIVTMALSLASLAILLPALALTLWWVQRRKWSSITSVTGRLRLPWLGRCFAVAAVVFGISLGALAGVEALTNPDAPSEGSWVGWGTFALSIGMLVVLVPLQAAAEEFICRGWFLQAAGSLLRRPILIIIPQALLFAAAHGWGTPWGFADLTVFGLVLGWLTIRTGGLEAAIALHVTNNLVAMGIAAAYTGGLGSEETAADLPWHYALIDMTMTILFAILILQLAKRYKPTTHLVSSS